jgi:hypothetical protein
MAMANTIPLPYKADNVTVTADFNLTNAVMYAGYMFDGSEAQDQFFTGTIDVVFNLDVGEAGANPAGYDFGVVFYVQAFVTDSCAAACLRYLEVSYTLPKY